jgi:hypothetical protein
MVRTGQISTLPGPCSFGTSTLPLLLRVLLPPGAHESLCEAIHRLDVPYTSSSHRKDAAMINGAHAILYSDDADATRATLAKILGTRSVDAGGG